MKSLSLSCSCLGAALALGASGASAQILVQSPPSAAPAAPIVPPAPLRIVPRSATPIFPASPLTPGVESMPRMAPMPGVAPIPNGASTPGQAPAPRMAPMPGTGAAPDRADNRRYFVLPGSIQRLFIAPQIEPKPFISPAPVAPPVPARPDAMVADGDFLYILRGDTLVKIDKKTLKVVGSTTLPTANLSAAPLTTPRSSKSGQLPLTLRDFLEAHPCDDLGIFARPQTPKP